MLENAVRFREPPRPVYNELLVAVTVGWVTYTWPLFPGLTWASLPPTLGLSLLANVCYCAAYLVDVPMLRFIYWQRVEAPRCVCENCGGGLNFSAGPVEKIKFLLDRAPQKSKKPCTEVLPRCASA